MVLHVFNHEAVETLLPVDECIEIVRHSLIALAESKVHQPLRMVVAPEASDGLMAMMPCHISGDTPAFGLKAVCVFHENPKIGKDAHQGLVLLVDPATGEPQAVLDASAITKIRTAAASAVATDVLARPDASRLAIIGTGVQARAHLLAMMSVRPITNVSAIGRDANRLQQFIDDMSPKVTAKITAASSIEDAVRDTDLIVTATTAKEPILQAGWIAPGCHINAVGSSIPTARELSSELMATGLVFADRRESLINESGDFLMAVNDGAIDESNIVAEVGEVLVGQAPGRNSDNDITIFKSLGLAVQDVASAQYVLKAGLAHGIGQSVSF